MYNKNRIRSIWLVLWVPPNSCDKLSQVTNNNNQAFVANLATRRRCRSSGEKRQRDNNTITLWIASLRNCKEYCLLNTFPANIVAQIFSKGRKKHCSLGPFSTTIELSKQKTKWERNVNNTNAIRWKTNVRYKRSTLSDRLTAFSVLISLRRATSARFHRTCTKKRDGDTFFFYIRYSNLMLKILEQSYRLMDGIYIYIYYVNIYIYVCIFVGRIENAVTIQGRVSMFIIRDRRGIVKN